MRARAGAGAARAGSGCGYACACGPPAERAPGSRASPLRAWVSRDALWGGVPAGLNALFAFSESLYPAPFSSCTSTVLRAVALPCDWVLKR